VLVGRDFTPADVPAVCQGLQVSFGDTRATPVVCDVSAIVEPDLGTIDGLARLALALRRLGLDVRLDRASAELTTLVALAGLADVVPCWAELPVEVRREPEHGEELRRVEEEDDPADPAR
jgi:STAS domain